MTGPSRLGSGYSRFRGSHCRTITPGCGPADTPPPIASRPVVASGRTVPSWATAAATVPAGTAAAAAFSRERRESGFTGGAGIAVLS